MLLWKMRSLRTAVGGLGASASVVAGAAILLALLTGGLAFHAWSGGPDDGVQQEIATELPPRAPAPAPARRSDPTAVVVSAAVAPRPRR
ncbi:MAG: hypothetical protein JWR30_370, partial [Conexibacter sp.]|nr:hypothetical protein [Conexibacter sp.]